MSVSAHSPQPQGDGSLSLRELAVGYRDGRRRHVVLSGLNAQAHPGELTALIGPNGTGKSTLLRTIAGLQPALGGVVELSGRQLESMSPGDRARYQAIVLTERVAPGRLSAREMVALGRHPHTGFLGRLTAEDDRLVDEALVAVGAARLAHRDLAELSDGERQRVMTARALAQQPRLLLMDEPSAFLDAPGRIALTGLIRRIALERNVVAIVSTHEVDLALQVADRIWLIDRDGRLDSRIPEDLMYGGRLGEVFDSEDLEFDAQRGGFRLVGNTRARVRVSAEPGLAVTHLLARRGWARDDEGPSEVELQCAPPGQDVWELMVAGRTQQVQGLDALARFLAADPDTEHFARVGPQRVREAVAQAASFGPYFTVAFGEEGVGLQAFDDQQLQRYCQQTAARLGSQELRVGTLTWQFSLLARIWSLLVGPWAQSRVIPDLDGLRVREEGSAFGVCLTVSGGWLDLGATPEQVASVMVAEVRRLSEPLHAQLRDTTRIATGLLAGNRAAAAIGAVRAAQSLLGEGDLDPLLDALLAQPLIGDHVDVEQGSVLRRSCCLYYRGESGGTCPDCPVTPSDQRAT
ncbi:ATP-binding cassette domain-containing protein [Gephyromycinifex aptenodytis]|uniref:ATP-binding cassette domain-containing protein n=1 Tax=Gephyromycinifex aptenodytis TaxID=2716227 RepID=UPI0014477DE7|nr:ATP-binding cassette domain-containing protein [Gephyromycinifex aptenodytis]